MIIKCPECNESASSKAFACPRCGEPMQWNRYTSAFRTLALVWGWVLSAVFAVNVAQLVILSVAIHRISADIDIGGGTPAISTIAASADMMIILIVAWLPYLGWYLAVGRTPSSSIK